MTHDMMTGLCQSIPAIGHMPETRVFDAETLAKRWATASGGERAAIAFVLNVYNNDWRMWQEEYGIPPFTIEDFARLDDGNRAAIATWFARPFFP